MLNDAGRLTPELLQLDPESVVIFVVGLSGVQPLEFCVSGKSPFWLKAQLNKPAVSVVDTTIQYDDSLVSDTFGLKLND
jgi:hypothetical protein